MALGLRVPGSAVGETEEFRAEAGQLGFDDGLQLQLRDEVRIDATARSDAAQVRVDGAEHDVVEIVHSDGYVDFSTFKGLQEASASDRGAASAGDVNLLRAIEGAQGPSTRGERSTAEAVRRYGVTFPAKVVADLDILKGVKDVIGRAVEPFVQEAARRVIAWAERPAADDAAAAARRERPKVPGLYRVTFDLHLEPGNRVATPPPSIDEPYLLLVHGTQSHTENAFGALAGTDEWQRLFDGYEGNVLAFEHPTLSVSPLENALALAQSLPEAGRLDIVSHSRGGLVADVLSLAAGGHLDLTVLERSGRRQAEIDMVKQLFEAVGERNLEIRRYVRAGCPASGTLLASGRLDQYAKWLFWAIRKIPGFGGIGAILKTVILSILELRMDTDVAPGLEAQRPESPFIRWLNTNRETVADGLAVLAADVQGSGIKGRAAVAASDLFYREDHDYVVNTRAMTQGARRGVAHYSFNKGHDATHFTYFEHPGSRAQLAAWLLRDDDEPPGGFIAIDRDARKLVEPRRRGALGTAPIVVVVPAFMGNALLMGDRQVWPSPEELATEGIEAISPTTAGIEPGEPLAHAYQKLADGLGSAGLDMVHLGWDWRLPLDAAVERLATRLEELVEKYHEQAVHVLGHSTGGLVALLLAARLPDLWTRIREAKGRMVLVGCPTSGTHRALQLATAEDELVQMIALLDPAPGADSVAYLFRNYPAVLASLPGPLDEPWWEDEWWSDTLGRAPSEGVLAAARSIRRELEESGEPDGVVHVAGSGRPTAVAFDPSRPGFSARLVGDGVVTLESAAPAHSRSYVAPGASHGELVRSGEVVRSIAALLSGDDSGDALEPVEAFTPATVDEPEVMRSPAGKVLFPTASDFAEAVLGIVTSAIDEERTAALHIEVLHGDLRNAAYPIVVGHYEGSTLKGAEAAVDRMLDGALRDRHLLGVYPGPVGTVDIILRSPEARPPGTLVVGLGEIGDITPTKVTRSITQMALRYALLVLERAQTRRDGGDSDGEPGCVLANFSTLLIGTSGDSALNVSNSMAAVVKGALAANRLLEERGLLERVRIGQVQFVELYEDLAVEAAHAAQSLTFELGVEERVRAADRLHPGEGGLPGRPQLRYDEGQWRRVEVETRGDGEGRRELVFTTTGSRARAEQNATAGQRELVDELVAEAVNAPQASPQVHNTLFELLLPNTMKNQARQTDNLLFVLDREAANYPWEVLAGRSSAAGEERQPLSTQAGMLRRLKTPRFREAVQTASGMKALVIGDPPAGDDLPELPGARQEAAEVAALLRDIGYEVTERIRGDGYVPTSLDLVNALFADDYRIIHIAAHGHYDADNPERSGVVIGPGRYLSPLLVRQIQAMPALVFLNCCHLGQIEQGRPAAGVQGMFHLFAASVSQQLIEDGIKAVVAAGWAVDDIAARQFAREFYENLLRRGKPFGDATHLARSIVYQEHGSTTNTWGAYQCYGDPGFSLAVAKDDDADDGRIVARAELLARARSLAEVAATADSAAVRTVTDGLERLIRSVPKDWIDGDVAYQIGNAYTGVREFEDAIRYHRTSKSHWSRGRVFRLLRVLAYNESRRALELQFDPPADMTDEQRREKIDEYLDEATLLLQALIEVTPEDAHVHAHYASHEKRRAHIKSEVPEVRDKALELAASHYRQAYELWLRQRNEVLTWPAMNWAGLRCLRQILDEQPDKDDPPLLDLIEACQETAQREGAAGLRPWHAVVEADARLYRMLASGQFGSGATDDEVEQLLSDIQDAYDATLRTRPTLKFRHSVVEQLRFIAHMLRYHKVEHERLAELAARVERMFELTAVEPPA